MELKVIGTGSSGNSYILTDEGGNSLVLEIGVNFSEVQKSLKYDLSKVLGIFATHEHGDHSKGMNKALYYGVNVYATEGTYIGLNIDHRKENKANVIKYMQPISIGEFKVLPFDVQHDVNEPCGFVISHPESGNILFLTDTTYCKYNFPNLSHIITEANYCEDILSEGDDDDFLKKRIVKSHLSIQNVELMLKRWDLSNVQKIILIHLSNRNADPGNFEKRIISKFGKTTHAAVSGSVFQLNESPF